METEIREFYDSRGFEMSKLIARCPKKLPGKKIFAAAIETYREIQKGLDIRDVGIPRYVWAKAAVIDSDKTIKDYDSEIEGKFRGEAEYLKDRNKKLKNILYAYVIVSVGLVMAYFGILYEMEIMDFIERLF